MHQVEILFQIVFIINISGSIRLVNSDFEYFKAHSKVFDGMQIVILFRLFRISPFLYELEQWNFFARAVNVMKGPFFNLVFCLFSVYYLWTLIGIEIYGGKIDTQLFVDVADLNPDTEIGPTYMWLNFNDFASGLLTLFSMMLFNNWQFIWAQFNFAIESDLITNGFFLTFMCVSQYVIINIIMAFVIDVYTSIEDQVRNEKEEKEALIILGMQEIQFQREEAKRKTQESKAAGNITSWIHKARTGGAAKRTFSIFKKGSKKNLSNGDLDAPEEQQQT